MLAYVSSLDSNSYECVQFYHAKHHLTVSVGWWRVVTKRGVMAGMILGVVGFVFNDLLLTLVIGILGCSRIWMPMWLAL